MLKVRDNLIWLKITFIIILFASELQSKLLFIEFMKKDSKPDISLIMEILNFLGVLYANNF